MSIHLVASPSPSPLIKTEMTDERVEPRSHAAGKFSAPGDAT